VVFILWVTFRAMLGHEANLRAGGIGF
jgi:hypothetical protein